MGDVILSCCTLHMGTTRVNPNFKIGLTSLKIVCVDVIFYWVVIKNGMTRTMDPLEQIKVFSIGFCN